jgi:hypothetical protein
MRLKTTLMTLNSGITGRFLNPEVDIYLYLS